MCVSSVDSQRLGCLEGPPLAWFLRLSVVFWRREEGAGELGNSIQIGKDFPVFSSL